MKDLHLSFLTRGALHDPAIAGGVLEVIFGAHPDLRPRRYGGYEPLPHTFGDDSTASELLAIWASPVFWTQGRRTDGSFFFGADNQHSSIQISCTSSRVQPELLARLLRDLAGLLAPDLASIYYQFESEELGRARYDALYPFCIGPTTHDLRRSIPDLPWYTIFGPSYVELFGIERLVSCPCFVSGPFGETHWLLQLVEDPRSARSSQEAYSRVRNDAKLHLGADCFLDLESPRAQKRTPDYSWSPARRGLGDYLREKGLIAE